jgi:iron complex outermembrane receptor protein
MQRQRLLRGVSAGAISILGLVALDLQPADAQTSLPNIDVGAHVVRTGPKPKTTRPAPRAARVQPAPAPVAPPPPAVSTWSPTLANGKPAFVEKFQLPNTVASVTRQEIEDKVNIVDTEDAVKYMPSLFVRKRNNGDTQPVLQTRTWGVNSSARSLVYADDLLLTALIGNDNSIGAPRWGLVAPEEIERIDFLYGPFSAQHSGNALGGVMQITTRMPEKLEVTAKNTSSIQDFSLWGTSKTLYANETAITIGDKINDFSWLVTGNWLHGDTQPLTYVQASSGSFPTSPANLYGYPGGYFGTTKFGVPATVLGSAGNLSNDQVNAKLKLAYDITPTIRATYTLGFWSNDGTSTPENYLVQGYGPYFGPAYSGKAGVLLQSPSPAALTTSVLQSFGSAYYRVQEKQLVNSAAIKSNTKDWWDFEISASNFDYLQSDQVSPFSGAVPYGGYTENGKNAVYTGTYWTLLDAKGIVRPFGYDGPHEVSFGLHGDQFHLNNPTWLTSNWTGGTADSLGVVSSIGDGTTQTQALWAQDAWKINKEYKLTLGIRGEHWQASDGYTQGLNGIGTTGLSSTASLLSTLPVYQPVLEHTRFSPKGSFQWTPNDVWTVTANIGLANRFPTAKELYNQTSLTGNAPQSNPNPNLRPEVALSKELAFERKVGPDGSVRLSLFDEEVRDAIISQNLYAPTAATYISSNVNIDRIRNSGAELAWKKDNIFFKGLEYDGSVTYVNSRIISDSTWAPTGGNNLDQGIWSVAGKNVPYVPKWRWTTGFTYHPDEHWSFSINARWQDRMWSTLSNNDFAHGVYGSFDRFFVVDTKITYKLNDHFKFSFGIDNLNNYKYFLFHPFPQRTFVMSAKYEFGTTEKNQNGMFYTGQEGFMPRNWLQSADDGWWRNFKFF